MSSLSKTSQVNMAVWSTFLRSSGLNTSLLKSLKAPIASKVTQNALQIRQMSDHGPRNFAIIPSRFQWDKFKDNLHFFVMIGAIPISAILFYVNIFIGPAKLRPIPEGYTPKHWEYHRHPVTRFLSRYVYPSPQQEYEKYLHFVSEEKERMLLRDVENKIRRKMGARNDYQAYYYKPAVGKYHRISREESEYLESLRGD